VLGRSIGLDIGSHSIKVVELRQTLRGIELVRVNAVPVVEDATPGPGVVSLTPEAGAAEGTGDAGMAATASSPFGPAVERALRECVSTSQGGLERVICAIPGEKVTRRRMRMPFRDRRRIAQAVPFEVESETPFALEDVFVDWELAGNSRTSADVLATVVARREVAARLAALRDAGIAPRVLEVEGLVLANLAEWVELPGTRLLLDLGHRQSTLCLLVDGAPRAARTLPIGGRHLTDAIARERRISLAEAEAIKCREGVLGFPPAGAAGPAARVLERLARELVRSLGSFESVLGGSAEKAIEGLVLLGGGARLQRIDTFLAEQTGIPTTRLAVAPGSPAGALLAAGDPLRFAPALALALRGTFKARTRTNFLQEEFAPRLDLQRVGRRLRGTAWLAAAALVLAVAAGANRIAIESRRADRVEAELSALWSEAAPGRPTPAQVPAALQQALRDAQQRAALLGIYGGSLSALDLLGEVSRLVPPSLEVVFEELSIDGQVMRIRGHTSSYAAVDQLKAALAGFPHFTDIRVAEIQTDAVRGGNNFSITVSLAKVGSTP
jgi:type IV pilus assembly protein PilM